MKIIAHKISRYRFEGYDDELIKRSDLTLRRAVKSFTWVDVKDRTDQIPARAIMNLADDAIDAAVTQSDYDDY
jgi:hypothetical protein